MLKIHKDDLGLSRPSYRVTNVLSYTMQDAKYIIFRYPVTSPVQRELFMTEANQLH